MRPSPAGIGRGGLSQRWYRTECGLAPPGPLPDGVHAGLDHDEARGVGGEILEFALEGLGSDWPVVAHVADGTEEAADIDHAGLSGEFADEVLLLVDRDAG